MILYMYIAPGQGQTTFWGQNFDVNRNSLSLCPFVASLKKISLKSDFFTIFYVCFFHMYIAPGRGRQPIGGKNYMTKAFSLCPYVASFKMISLKSILFTFLMIFNI